MDYKRYAKQREQLNFDASIFTKEINGKTYKYRPVGEHLFSKESPNGKISYIKQLPDDAF